MVDILLTNDDGYNALGYTAMLNELSDYDVVGVAPKGERSWIGKSIGAHEKHFLKKESDNIYSFTGTPADCVQVGIYNILKKHPKLVISGINKGANVGHSRILSSGTIGAAMEASIDGVRSIATSMHIPQKGTTERNNLNEEESYKIAAKISLKIIKMFINTDFPKGMDLLVVNIPYNATIDASFELTVPDRQPIGQLFFDKGDHHKHHNPTYKLSTSDTGSDMRALHEGKVSITPLSLELVSKNTFGQVQKILDKQW